VTGLVTRDAPLPMHDRPEEYRPARFPVPLDLFPFTRAELEARRRSPVVSAAQASRWRYLREGSLT
jgi:hypothetical protein